MSIDWPAIRARFPVTERCVYLNAGWSGPSSRDVVAAMRQRLEREAYDGPTSPDVRYEKAMLVRRALNAAERIATHGVPSGTPSALEWTAKMLDGED